MSITPNTSTNIGRILAVMADGKWRSISIIKEQVYNQFGVTLHEKAIGAQLRDLRKKSLYLVNVQKVNEGKRGTFEYQVLEQVYANPAEPINGGPVPTLQTPAVEPNYEDFLDDDGDLDEDEDDYCNE